MQQNLCKTCGGDLHRVGNTYICQACGNRWTIDAAEDVHVVDRANAWAALRDGNFEHAAELFETIHEKEPKDHEAFWGLALAGAGILYVVDYAEHKRVPTCNNIGEDSFLGSKNVKKAIEYAPSDIAESYRQQAEQIERIRNEWLQKARKEPPYDVFLSYKDSDREHGIDRTQDSVDAQDLYNMLTAEGYKVFFSRISLRDKVSEHYEPYIYNAIKTAKVMIVFGEKAEYFSSTWIKNEWSRFKKRVEDGEKHPNSLIVVCKNMNPGDLPVVLRSRQCLNADDITFGNDLIRHIEKVVSLSKGNEHLEKIKISGGQIGKKASSISQNSINKREIGQNSAAKTSISEKQSLMLVESYIKEKQWEEADRLLEDVLFNNPSFAEAIWCKLLINQKVTTNSTLVRILDRFKPEDYALIEKALNCASVEFAGRILDLLYQSCKILPTHVRETLYNLILPYRYERRSQRLKENFEWCIANREFKLFKLLLSALESDDVDEYIQYNCQYIKATLNHQEKRECTDNILAVDEGNRVARMYIFESELSTATQMAPITEAFENVLKYSEDIDADVEEAAMLVTAVLSTPLHCQFAQQLPKYYTGDLKKLHHALMGLGNRMIAKTFFTEAQAIFNLILSIDESDAEAFWGLCLAKTNSTSEEQIINSPILLNDQAEYQKYLSLVTEERRVQCLRLAKKQQTTQKSRRRKKVRIITAASVSAALIAGAVLTVTYILPTVQLGKADDLYTAGNYAGANELYQKLNGFGDSIKRAEAVQAIQQMQNGNPDAAVQTLLAAGIPVEITYNAEGGALEGTDALVLGHTLSTDTSLIPLTAGESTATYTINPGDAFEKLMTPVRGGYTFANWTAQAFSYDITGKDPVFHMTLSAVWTTKTNVINYKLEGGELNGENPKQYSVEDEDITLIEPTRKGYVFLGWTWEVEGEAAQTTPTLNVTIPKGSHGDRVYTANWKALEYKITLNYLDDAGTVSEMIVSYGTAFTLPVPTREGYSFAGWYNSSSETLFSDGVWTGEKDITLNAHWFAEEYYISYEMNGGTNAAGNPDSYVISDAVVLGQPTRQGYTFLGWTYKDSEENLGVDLSWPAGTSGKKELVAHWSANVSTIQLDAAGGSCGTAQMTVQYDTDMVLPTPEWSGRTFSGWYLNTTRIENGTCTIAESCTLVAKWDAIPYSITYNLDGGTNAVDNPATYTCNDEIVLLAPSKTGYTFLGWSEGGQGTPVLSMTIPAGSVGEKTFKAHWTRMAITVTLDAAGGSCETSQISMVYGDTISLPTPEWEGHNFEGWYLGETLVSDGSSQMTENCTLVAHWSTIEYTITYENIQNGVNPEENPEAYTFDDTFTLRAPTRDGYTFLGWTYEGQDTPVTAVTVAVGTVGNKTYTAVWEANSYTVTLDPNGGAAEFGTMDVVFGEEYTLPVPVREGHTFAGWYLDTAQIATSGAWQHAESITLEAHWTADTFQVTLEDVQEYDSKHEITYIYNDEGTEPTVNRYGNGDVLTYMIPAARAGYAFAGWFTTETCDGAPYDFSAELTEDVTLYAKWVPMSGACDGTIYVNGLVENISFAVGAELLYAFVSPTTQEITAYTSHASGDPLLTLYDADMNSLGIMDDDSRGNKDASITWSAEAGVVYYIGYACRAAGTGSLHTSGSLPEGGLVVADSQDGWHYTPDSDQNMEIVFGEELTLPTPVRTGYTFMGWYLGEDPITSGAWNMAEDTVLTARWELNSYTLELDGNGGTLESEEGAVETLTLTISYGDTYTLPTPVREGYKFSGWYCYSLDSWITATGEWTWTPSSGAMSFEAEWTRVSA